MKDLEYWCEHITVVNEGYEIYDKYVPFSWIVCPECGVRKPD